MIQYIIVFIVLSWATAHLARSIHRHYKERRNASHCSSCPLADKCTKKMTPHEHKHHDTDNCTNNSANLSNGNIKRHEDIHNCCKYSP